MKVAKIRSYNAIQRLSILIFCMIPLIISAQLHNEINKINADSLQRILYELSGHDKIDALNKIALGLSYTEPDSSIKTAKEAIYKAELMNYQKGIADAHLSIGLSYFLKDSLKTCIRHYLDALHIYETADTSLELGLVYTQLQAINHMTGRYDKARAYGRKALKVFQRLSYHLYVVEVLSLQGLICSANNEFDSAEYYFNKGLSILKDHPEPLSRNAIYFNIGFNISRKYNQLNTDAYVQDAIDQYHKTIKFCEETSDSICYALSLYNLSVDYNRIETDEAKKTARKCIQELIKYAESTQIRPHTVMAAYRQSGLYEYQDGNIKKAIQLSEKAISRGKARKDSFTLQDYKGPVSIILNRIWFEIGIRRCYNNLNYYYQELGDYKRSLEYYQLYKEAEDNILQQENKNLIAMLESDFEDEKTQNQIISLVREKDLSDLRAQQARNINIGIGVIFLVLILVGILFIRQNKLQNEHKNTILEQKLLRLQMNPHFIFNALSSIHSLLNPNDVEKASTYVGKFSRLLRTTLESSREDFILLEDEINSLSHYMELQQLRYDHKFDFSIEVDEKIDTENAIIPPMIIQPFVENAIEHGVRHRLGNGYISIRFLLKKNQIVCEVEDDGVGRRKAWETKYTKRQKHKSLATDIIRDRIKILNKKFQHNIKLEIIDLQSETQLAMGTLVRLNLPYLLD